MVYRAALYLRVSKEDSKRIEQDLNNSIENQKHFLLDYLKDQPEIEVYDCYMDCGYSGLLFEERPGFLRMWRDILDHIINMVIVKDLSRFGREHIKTDMYIRKIFPALGVRFLAVADSYDSLFAKEEERNLLIPIKNFINDSYARDISIKIRSSQEAMRREGICAGAYVPYGYRKERGKLFWEAESAMVVRLIYLLKLEGESASSIANLLNKWGISSPAEFRREKGSPYYTGFQEQEIAKWAGGSVDRILKDRIYTGVLEQGKRMRISYKVRTVVSVPKEKWSVVRGTHLAIISEEEYKLVQEISLFDTRRSPKQKGVYLFSGLFFCGDCRQSMIRRNGYSKKKNYYICASYNKGEGCSRHAILERTLFSIVYSVIEWYRRKLKKIPYLKVTRGRSIWEVFIQRNQKKIERDRERIRQTEEDFCKGIFDQEEYQQYQLIYQKEQEEREQAILFCRQEKRRREEERQQKKGILDRMLLVFLIEKIEMDREKKIRIWVRFRMDI